MTACLTLLTCPPLHPCSCVYIAPMEALAKERFADWSKRFGQGLGLNVVQLTGEAQADLKLLEKVRQGGEGNGVQQSWELRGAGPCKRLEKWGGMAAEDGGGGLPLRTAADYRPEDEADPIAASS